MHDAGEGRSSIERQLGEVVGTVRMTVNAVETLRETVEKLAERASFRADLDVLRAETTRHLEDVRTASAASLAGIQAKLDGTSKKIEQLQRFMYTAMGGMSVLIVVLNFLRPVITKYLGV